MQPIQLRFTQRQQPQSIGELNVPLQKRFTTDTANQFKATDSINGEQLLRMPAPPRRIQPAKAGASARERQLQSEPINGSRSQQIGLSAERDQVSVEAHSQFTARSLGLALPLFVDLPLARSVSLSPSLTAAGYNCYRLPHHWYAKLKLFRRAVNWSLHKTAAPGYNRELH